MLFFAITMVVLALVLYTASIWAYVISGRLYSLTLALFGIGFVCDVAGTIAMSSLRSGVSMSTHGIIAWFAMMLMLALLIAMLIAYHEQRRMESRVRWFAVSAWVLWVSSFFSALW
ncbi:MAG: hypothetical protein AAB490_02605 [Patescibacteria group bacterium]